MPLPICPTKNLGSMLVVPPIADRRGASHNCCFQAPIRDFQPLAIIDQLKLRTPIFLPTAAYGHFGRTPESRCLDHGRSVDLFPWEKSDRVDDIRTELKL